MISSPFFTVVIPTYNRSHSIIDAVKSVLTQSFSDFELLIIDDGSTDNTRVLIGPFAEKDARVNYVYQENAERSAARNHGISLAKGKYICFLDSDDLYLPDHLLEFRKVIESNHYPIALIICNVVYPDSNGYRKVEPFITETNDPMELIIKTAICSQQTCIHREVLEKHQYDRSIRIGEDQELWTRIVRVFPVIRSDQYTVVIRDLGDRTIDETNLDSYTSNIALKKRLFKADTNGRIKPEWRRFILSGSYFKLALIHLNRNEKVRFYLSILRSILISPTHYWKDKLVVIASTLPFLNRRFKRLKS